MHDYLNAKYYQPRRPRFVARGDIGKFGGTDWTPAPRDYLELELLQEFLDTDDAPRGGAINVSAASDKAWEHECLRRLRQAKAATATPESNHHIEPEED